MLQIFYPYQCCLHSSIRTVNGLQVYVRFYLCFLSFSICLPSCNLFHILLVRQTTFFGLYQNYVPPPPLFQSSPFSQAGKGIPRFKGHTHKSWFSSNPTPFPPFLPLLSLWYYTVKSSSLPLSAPPGQTGLLEQYQYSLPPILLFVLLAVSMLCNQINPYTKNNFELPYISVGARNLGCL